MPTILQTAPHPFSNGDLLAIGTALVVVMTVLAVRKLFGRKR